MNSITNLYNRKVTMSNWQLSVFKLSVFCLSLAIGCYFADFVRPYLVPLLAIGIVTSVWITMIWLKAMKETP
jgi:hypothetical protein